DILVGTPIANRHRQEIEGLIGFFTNTLVMRTDLSGTPTFKDLLARVRQTALDAYKHQDLPFEKLVEVLQPNRDLSYNPIFQVLFGLRNIKLPTLELPEVTLTPQELDRKTSRFDLSLDLWEDADGISGVFEYSTDLFDASTIGRMVGHFQTLLEGIVANPDRPISTLPLLTAAEQHQILLGWNNTQTNYSENRCLHQLIEQQAEKYPDNIAVVFADQKLTYKELNQRANQLAHYLQKLGIKPEMPVGIYVERSLEMIIGLLGILKAGGAYVPLDPAYANERLHFMLEDAQVQVLLTQKHLNVETAHELQTVYLDVDWGKISLESTENPASQITPDNLAYIIYTSGSTGKPKGVQVNHRSVVHLFGTTRSLFNFDQSDAWTVFHSYAFDFSVWEIWGALTNGSKLVIVSQELTHSPSAFYELLCQEQVTVLNQTPSAIRQLIHYRNNGKNWNLRLMCCGGEALPAELAAELLQFNVPLWNFYGPTEATVWAGVYEVKSVFKEGVIPIGRPLPDTQLYILDVNLQPVPIGVFGELHIGGAGLSRGYLNRPELTAEKFISNPFVNLKSARFYKTGDLARYLPDGTIEFVGRIDHQVKIRGFRIELGEIEAVLSQHPEVQQVVVIAREDNPGDKRIVAYIVSTVETLHTKSLRGFLKDKLPEYMIPSAFVLLEALPLTPNGKIDRRALPTPDNTRLDVHTNFVAPRNPTEEVIADIWTQVLGVEQIGIDDNFFELGGHSLLATQVVSRLRKAFGVELPLRYLFESPTVAGLSDRLLHQNNQNLDTSPIQRISRQNELPLSFAQERLWFLDQLKPGDSAYNIPSAVRLQGALN
ncbi:MAG TPA: amino acid adenylation domain-containing protein, partial [Candidatus Obscuribacterales bacterium]